jgi:hypothetical protein
MGEEEGAAVRDRMGPNLSDQHRRGVALQLLGAEEEMAAAVEAVES